MACDAGRAESMLAANCAMKDQYLPTSRCFTCRRLAVSDRSRQKENSTLQERDEQLRLTAQGMASSPRVHRLRLHGRRQAEVAGGAGRVQDGGGEEGGSGRSCLLCGVAVPEVRVLGDERGGKPRQAEAQARRGADPAGGGEADPRGGCAAHTDPHVGIGTAEPSWRPAGSQEEDSSAGPPDGERKAGCDGGEIQEHPCKLEQRDGSEHAAGGTGAAGADYDENSRDPGGGAGDEV
eukprot:758566-Hanusia_phi.AAC.3